MKKVIVGFSLALLLIVVIFKLIERNHEKLLEMVKSLPRPIKIDGDSSLKSLFSKSDNEDIAA